MNIKSYKILAFIAIIIGLLFVGFAINMISSIGDDSMRRMEIISFAHIAINMGGFSLIIIVVALQLILSVKILEALKANGQKTRQLIERRLQRELKEQQKN